ncbi:MAG: ABC transporter ATP-binding protein [Anaerolineae bacterium]|nr:ABC transporter ATP-binding protein [Anaerolineae bacterium]
MFKVSELSYSYGQHQVLHNLSFELSPGEIAILAGRNGAGKSTLLRCLAGWSKPEIGGIYLDDRLLFQEQSPQDPDIIFVPDVPDFYDELTIWEHLRLISSIYHVADWEEEADNLLVAFELEDAATAFPFSLSRGMRQKLALIMALIVRPKVLFLDEPFGPLDINATMTVWQQLNMLKAYGSYILLSSHTLPEGSQADRYLLMQRQQVRVIDETQFDSMSALLNYDDSTDEDANPDEDANLDEEADDA